MKTLFVYCSSDSVINSLCRESAFRRAGDNSLQLAACRKSFLKSFLGSRGKENIHSTYDISMESFDRIIIACDEFAGVLPVCVTNFIEDFDFRYKTIDCIIFGEGRFASKAKDALKVKFSLSGGTVHSCVNVSSSRLKREAEDVLFSVRHSIAV